MRRSALVLALAVSVLLPAAAAGQNARRSGQANAARREALQAQVIRQFADRTGTRLGLAAGDRQQLLRILQSSNEQRRGLARETAELRRQLNRAVRDPDTSDVEFRRILAAIGNLRQREHDLWKQDQQELARVLTPRQQAQFVVEWLRFQQRVRQLIDGRRQDARPPGGPPR